MLPVILCLDCMNWDWTLVFSGEVFKDMEAAWTGDYFDLFFKTAMLYFVVDLVSVSKIFFLPLTSLHHR